MIEVSMTAQVHPPLSLTVVQVHRLGDGMTV